MNIYSFRRNYDGIILCNKCSEKVGHVWCPFYFLNKDNMVFIVKSLLCVSCADVPKKWEPNSINKCDSCTKNVPLSNLFILADVDNSLIFSYGLDGWSAQNIEIFCGNCWHNQLQKNRQRLNLTSVAIYIEYIPEINPKASKPGFVREQNKIFDLIKYYLPKE